MISCVLGTLISLYLPCHTMHILSVQSLEALRDGEHEKQRRHFLYFLLHQVPVSSNFSILARRIGHKVGLVLSY